MGEASPQGGPERASAGGGHEVPSTQPGVIGIALAAVLTAALAQGAWEWFATYIGVTLLAVVVSFSRLPTWTPGFRSAYFRNLLAFSLIVGLCFAVMLAPLLQRTAWLFPMPATRRECTALGKYEDLRLAPVNPTPEERVDFAHSRGIQRHATVADCLASTTTRWLPAYGSGAAVLVWLGIWSAGRARAKRETGPAANPDPDQRP